MFYRHHLLVAALLIGAGLIVITLVLTRQHEPHTNSETSFDLARHSMSTTTILVNNSSFEALLAVTPSQQQQGLGGFTSLGPNQAMYFPLINQQNASFWMKGMVIPIDIVWIKHSVIVSIDQNISPPKNNTPDTLLPTYHSAVANPDAVLEIAANRSRQLGIKAGDSVMVNSSSL